MSSFSLRLALLSPPACRDPLALHAAVAGKTVLFTGASFGIGEATARLFAGAGAHVILLARSEERLQLVARSIREAGGEASVYALDLARTEETGPLMAFLLTQHPRLDIVVSNAGKSIRRSVLHSAERDDLGRLLAVNFSGPAALITALLPRLAAQGGGQLVNVSSVAARLPGAPRWAAYQGSKAGFDLWLHSAATELGRRHVSASSVYLPLVHTRMSAATPLYARLPGLSALEAAQAVVRRPARVAPWWLVWSELAALLCPAPFRWVLRLSERSAPPGRVR